MNNLNIEMEQNQESWGEMVYLLSLRLIVSKWMLWVVVVLASFTFFFRLGEGSLKDWDEAIYAQVAKQMVASGEYLSQYWGNDLRFEKPPLVPWAIATSFKLFSINEFWARAASATSGVFLCIIIYLICKNFYTPQIGFIAVTTMLSMYEVVKRGRYATTDMMLTLFIYLAIFAYLKLDKQKQAWWYVLWISFALAFMTKFWAALIVPATLIIAILVDRKIDMILGSKQFWRGLIIAGFIVAPWHLLMYVRHGQQFLDIYILKNLIARSTTPLAGNTGDYFYYFRVMLRTFLPWIFMLPVSFLLELEDMSKGTSRSRVLLILSISTFSLYSLLITTKLQWYILPIYPALAIFIASNIDRAYRNHRTYAFFGLIFVTFIAILFSTNRLLISYLLLITPIAFLAIRYFGKIQSHQIATLAMYGLLLALSGTIIIKGRGVQPLYNVEYSPVSVLSNFLDHEGHLSETKPLIGVALEQDWDTVNAVEGPAAMFYTNKTVEVIFDLEELAELLQQDEKREILVAEKHLETLSESYKIDVIASSNPLVYGYISSR